MPHSCFKARSHALNSGVGKCSCGQTFDFASEKEMNMKLQIYRKVCSKPPKSSNQTRMLMKAMTLKEHQNNETEKIQRVHGHH